MAGFAARRHRASPRIAGWPCGMRFFGAIQVLGGIPVVVEPTAAGHHPYLGGCRRRPKNEVGMVALIMLLCRRCPCYETNCECRAF